MASFASSFWSTDYAGGLGVLFGKLQQGVQENEQILTIARMRAEAEDVYGQKLGDIEPTTNRIEGGFQGDDGASVKKAYEGMRSEMAEAARNHRKIASNIRELVVSPFSRWCEQHAARVQNSQDDLQGRIKAHDKQTETVRQYRSAYYNKCRRVEDLDEEEKLAFQDPNSAPSTSSPKQSISSVPSIKVEVQEEEQEPLEIGDELYEPEQLKKTFIHLLEHIKLGEAKVPILGTYQNVTTGAEIVEYIQQNLKATSVAYAERIGQDLINHGFLRLIGNMGNTFANSSRMNYQWRPKVFQLTGIPEKRPKFMGRTTTLASQSSDAPESPVDRVGEYLGEWNPLGRVNLNETPAEKLRREAREADERYKAAVRKLDVLRCNLEEAITDHLKFMERCELDRLKAIKSVVLDFSGAISNVIPSLQSTVDNMMLFQETVQPLGDLRYLLENYRTGTYCPKITTYENYYNKVDEQTFGVDIEARARSDRKRVPIFVTTLLTYLDSHYPDLEGDEARRSIWIVDVPLAATHHLRNQINNGQPFQPELLEKYEIPIVASVLKLYLIELPDSLVNAHTYDVIKTIYTSTAQSDGESARVQVLQSTLGQLRLANIATLDAIMTHFTRLVELTNADDAYIGSLASVLAPCILRPKQQNSLTMAEKFSSRLVRDLLANKDAIFGELKRQSALTHTNSGSTRTTRAISTDESKRKLHMVERQRAILAAQQPTAGPSVRSRQPSPGPGVRTSDGASSMHRRDRSRGPETRFPVAPSAVQSPSDKRIVSPTSASSHHKRDSLVVPQSPPHGLSQQHVSNTSPPKALPDLPRTNGALHQPPPRDDDHEVSQVRTSLDSKRLSQPVKMSASLSGPVDFMEPGTYYNSTAESTPTNSLSPVEGVKKSLPPVPPSSNPSSTIKMVEPEDLHSSRTDELPTKRDSLNRSTAAPARGTTPQPKKPTGPGGLQRLTSASSVRDNLKSNVTENNHSSSNSEITPSSTNNEASGVTLEDKPMDFD